MRTDKNIMRSSLPPCLSMSPSLSLPLPPSLPHFLSHHTFTRQVEERRRSKDLEDRAGNLLVKGLADVARLNGIANVSAAAAASFPITSILNATDITRPIVSGLGSGRVKAPQAASALQDLERRRERYYGLTAAQVVEKERELVRKSEERPGREAGKPSATSGGGRQTSARGGFNASEIQARASIFELSARNSIFESSSSRENWRATGMAKPFSQSLNATAAPRKVDTMVGVGASGHEMEVLNRSEVKKDKAAGYSVARSLPHSTNRSFDASVLHPPSPPAVRAAVAPSGSVESAITMKSEAAVILAEGQAVSWQARDQEQARAWNKGVYTVEAGDSVGGLAVRFNTSVAMLISLNRLSDVNLIRTGQRLIIRPPDLQEHVALATSRGDKLQGDMRVGATGVPITLKAAAREGPALATYGHTIEVIPASSSRLPVCVCSHAKIASPSVSDFEGG